MPHLNFNVPQLTSSGQESLPRPKEMEEWIAKLPVASITKTAKLLYKVIKKLNRIKIDPNTRLALTTPLAKAIDQNVRAAERHYIDAVLPLSIKLKHLAFIRIQLAEELSFTYKLMVQDLAQNLSGVLERKLLPFAIFHAIHRLSELIYTKALIYQLPPDLIGNELYTLFEFAETNKFIATDFSAALGPNGEEIECTIKDLYLRALIFTTATPIRLRQREICAVYLGLIKWAKVIRMRHITEFIPKPTCFILQTHGNYFPQHSTLVPRQLQAPAIELDTDFLIHVLQDLHDTMPTEIYGIVRGDQRDALTKSTIRRLIQVWGFASQRQFTRTHLNFELPLAIGLNAIYKLLTGQDSLQTEPTLLELEQPVETGETPNLGRDSDFAALDIVDTERNSGLTLVEDDNFNDSNLRISELDDFSINLSIEPPKTSMATSVSPYVILTTLNESIGGYCVDWSSNKAPGVKVGELISIAIPGNPPAYTLAVIRWIHDTLKHGMQVGLQVLAPNIEAVVIMNNKLHSDTKPINCLLISEFKAANLPASLIAPPLAFRMDNLNTNLIFKHGQSERQIRLIELLEATGAFARFSFVFQ